MTIVLAQLIILSEKKNKQIQILPYFQWIVKNFEFTREYMNNYRGFKIF